MSVSLTPHIGFLDTTREALTFYHGIFGGEVSFSTFKEFGVSEDPAEQDKIMHGYLKGDNGLELMAADTPAFMERPEGAAISLALSGEDEDELRGYWDQLSDGATIIMPLEAAPWGAVFGNLSDKFGVMWMVNIGG